MTAKAPTATNETISSSAASTLVKLLKQPLCLLRLDLIVSLSLSACVYKANDLSFLP
jgi:hypothetical protein